MLAWFHHPRLELGRAWAKALADRIAFVVESACVANAVFWFLTWAGLGFSWSVAAHQWGNFWTHYVAAAPSARQPVELFVAAVGAALTLATCLIRAPKASRGWDPWPASRRGPASGPSRAEQPEYAA
jgi:hypothetical protein